MYQEQIRGGVGAAPVNYAVTAYSQTLGDVLPGLPVLTTTRLQLELLLNDSVVDLKAVTDVILADAGATLQILRTVGREFAAMDGRPDRIEDCIVSLSAERCHQVVCASSGTDTDSYASEWNDCRRRAERARELAKDREGFSPEEAYLVGLLCRLGSFPQLLGWSLSASTSGEHHAVGVMLAFHWNLPEYLVAAIREQQEAVQPTKWRELLQLADEASKDAVS